MNKALEERMERKETAQKKYDAAQDRLDRIKLTADQIKAQEAAAQGEYEESQKMIDNVAKELEDTKATQYKETQKLFELRAKQASLIGEISSTLSASRNLTANINKLRVEEDRQQELLYNADYSIQQ
jgi:chromosome segregation ATPase